MAEKSPEQGERHTGKLKAVNPDGTFVITADISIRSFTVSPTPLSHLNIQLGDRVEFSVTPYNIVPHGPQCYSCHKVGHYARDCPSKLKKVKCYLCGKMGHYKWDCDRKFQSWGGGCGFEGGSENGSVVDFEKGVEVVSLERRESGVEEEEEDEEEEEEIEEDREDCFVLGFDPFKKVKSDVLDDEDEEEDDEEDDDGSYDDYDDDEEEEEDVEEDDEEEVRGMVSVKRREDVKKVEEVEDCFILEFDPSEEFSKLDLSGETSSGGGGGDGGGGEGDVAILGEKGKVACRDYPHPRHVCAKHPFKTTSHHLHCDMCYCYVCDVPAPCQHWTVKFGLFQHCDASSDAMIYREMRDSNKKVKG